MLGPRDMGAGTPKPQGTRPGRPTSDGASGAIGARSGNGNGNAGVALTPAQRLIERYERMNTPPPKSPDQHLARNKSTYRTQYVYDYKTTDTMLAAPTKKWHLGQTGYNAVEGATGSTPYWMVQKKDKSPIRQSLKNLLSVIRKGAGGLTKRKSDGEGALPPLSEPGSGDRTQLRDRDVNNRHLSDTVAAASSTQPKSSEVHTRESRKKLTGSLLYLTRGTQILDPELPLGPLTWATCSVTLDSDSHKLIVSSFMAELELYVHEIDLTLCSDIHSLSVSQLNEQESELLLKGVQNGDKMRVFEMTFKGRPKEKFAAKSVKERAGWISAIWDSILPCHSAAAPNGPAVSAKVSSVNDQPLILKNEAEKAKSTNHTVVNDTQSKRIPLESPLPKPVPQLSPLLEHSYFDNERALPALPNANANIHIPSNLPTVLPLNIDNTSIRRNPNLHIDLSEFQGPISPSIYSPTSISSSGETPAKAITQLSRLDTTSLGLETGSGGSTSGHSHRSNGDRTVIAPSIYPVSSHPGSLPTSPMTPPPKSVGSAASSPSITNLSQLSVVRQRLAQIERNHSQISAQSGSTFATRTSASPTPVSPTGSGWSKKEAVFLNARDSRKSSNSNSNRNRDMSNPIVRGQKGIRKFSPVSSGASKGKKKEKEAEYFSPSLSATQTVAQKDKAQSVTAEKSLPNLPPKPEPGYEPPAQSALTKEDIRKLSKDINHVKSVIGGESGYPTIHQIMVGLENRKMDDEKHLLSIHHTLDTLKKSIAENKQLALQSAEEATKATYPDIGAVQPKDDHSPTVLQAVKNLQEQISVEFPALATRLQEIKDSQDKGRLAAQDNDNLASATGSKHKEDNDNEKVDLRLVLTKLEEIQAFCALLPSGRAAQDHPDGKDEFKGEMKVKEDLSENMAKILSLIQEEGNKQTLLSQQQADSVRYLNELNSWLEAFVNNGTSQIQDISSNVDQLCHALGCTTELAKKGQDIRQPHTNLISDISQLVAGMKARDQNFTALQAAVRSLLDVLTSSQTQMGAETQAIAGLMNRQRQDQEALLRAFANDISGEIKGERLRFVEAMKEATAINVQVHVEQFKQELGREVMAMTEEVGRLHQEKQIVENQISDLFSFYSKHKQEEMPLRAIQTNAGIPPRHTQENVRANIPRSNHRLLPHPKPLY